MIAIFANSPFNEELRLDCHLVKMNTKAHGEVCILENYAKSVFDIENTIVELKNNDKLEKVNILGNAIVKVENNTINFFGTYEKLA